MKHAGNAIREWREAQGITQTDAAALLGWHQSTLSNVERGARPLSRAGAIDIYKLTNGELHPTALLIGEEHE